MKIFPFLTIVLLLFKVCTAEAATYTFTGSMGPYWTTSGNWTPSYPGTTIASGDSVLIQAFCISTGVPLLTNNGFLKLVNNFFEAGNTVNFGETWINPGTFMSSTSFTNKASAVIQINGEVNFSLTNETGGSVNVSTGAVFTGSFNNSGAFINNGQITTATGAESKILSGGTLTNNGVYSITTKALELHTGGVFVNSTSGSFIGDANNFQHDNLVLLGGSFNPGGIIESIFFAIKSNFTFDFSPDKPNFRVYAGFTMTINAGVDLPIRFRGYNSGTLVNNGTISADDPFYYTDFYNEGNGAVTNNGVISFGDFVMESTSTVSNTGTLNVDNLKIYNSAALTNSGDLNVLTQGEMINTSSMVNNGTVDMLLNQAGPHEFIMGESATCTNNAAGIFNIADGAQLRMNGVFTNHGTFNNAEKVITTSSVSTTSFANYGVVNNDAGAIFNTPKNFTNYTTGIFNNDGDYVHEGYNINFTNKGAFNNNASGYVRVQDFGFGDFKIREGVFIQNGTFDKRPSGMVSGPLTNGTGLITSGQTLSENGCPEFKDSIILSPSGSFRVKLNTPLNGCNQGYHDMFTLQDTIFLDGTLVFETGSSLQDMTFTAIEANLIVGTFSNFDWPNVSGFYFGVLYEPTKVKIIISTTPLPLEWLGFRAEKQGSSVKLAWETGSEYQNNGFYVQHSSDGHSFENIDFVPASGNNTPKNNYSFLHKTPMQAPVLYYRLRQEDLDGGFSYSPIQSIANPGLNKAAILPNPVSGPAKVYFDADDETRLSFSITDLQGRVLYHLPPFESVSGDNYMALPDYGLPSGMYFLRIESGNIQEFVRFIVR